MLINLVFNLTSMKDKPIMVDIDAISASGLHNARAHERTFP